MAPIPLEGNQTPLANSVPQEGNRGGSISLAMLIDFIIQRTYHELTVLADLLPRKTDMERKIEIYNYAARTRQLFVRLLGLVKWANSASKVDKSAHIMAFLDKQSLLFVDTADMLARMARETLVHARLPNFHIPAAVEVLTTGTYSRLPACIRERIVPPDPITPNERRTTLLRLNQVIQHRLVTGNLLPQMRNLKIEAGRVTFTVQHEFEVSLTVMGDGPNIPWRLLDIDILVQDKETGGFITAYSRTSVYQSCNGKALVHSLQVQYIHQVIQSRLVDNPYPLTEVYNCLHYFCQSLQLEVLYSQTLRLCRDRLDDHIHVDEYTPGKCLSISYWRELTSKDPRSELGYRLTVQVDQHDPAKPLTIVHVPSLGSKATLYSSESEIADRAIRSELLSMERLLVHTIYVRTRSRLSELKQELQSMLKDVECNLQGSPAILSVPVLQPCLRAEQLLVTVDTHTGVFQCHVPQYDAPLVPELQTALNGDHSRLPMLISELRYWVTQRRCEKTLQHLPATPHERLPLLHHPDHPMSKIGRHRMFVRLHRHPNVILIVEFKEKDNSPCEIECAFYLAVVKHSSIEDNPHDDSIETEIPKMYLKVLTLIEFDSFVITHGPFTGVDEQTEKPAAVKRKNSGKQEPAGRRSKHPAYFIPELAHMVAMCDERLPFVALAQELNRREIAHQGLQVEANATSLMLRLVEMPPPPGKWFPQVSWQHLLKRLLSITIRVHGKASKEWLAEFVFYGSPLASVNPKEQGLRRPVYFQYDMETAENVSKTVDALLCDWAQIVHLYMVVEDLAEYLRLEGSNLPNIVTIKSYSYSRLVLGYGPERAATVTVFWNSEEKAFKLIFGAVGNCVNAHLLMREQLEAHLNRYRDLGQIVSLLHETYEPMLSISKLPTIPQLGVHNLRPQVPVQAFTVMPQCPTLLRLAYQGMYCLELRLRGGGLVTLRDGAYSRFDRSNVVDEFTPTQGLKVYLYHCFAILTIFIYLWLCEDELVPTDPTPIPSSTAGHRHHALIVQVVRSNPSVSSRPLKAARVTQLNFLLNELKIDERFTEMRQKIDEISQKFSPHTYFEPQYTFHLEHPILVLVISYIDYCNMCSSDRLCRRPFWTVTRNLQIKSNQFAKLGKLSILLYIPIILNKIHGHLNLNLQLLIDCSSAVKVYSYWTQEALNIYCVPSPSPHLSTIIKEPVVSQLTPREIFIGTCPLRYHLSNLWQQSPHPCQPTPCYRTGTSVSRVIFDVSLAHYRLVSIQFYVEVLLLEFVHVSVEEWPGSFAAGHKIRLLENLLLNNSGDTAVALIPGIPTSLVSTGTAINAVHVLCNKGRIHIIFCQLQCKSDVCLCLHWRIYFSSRCHPEDATQEVATSGSFRTNHRVLFSLNITCHQTCILYRTSTFETLSGVFVYFISWPLTSLTPRILGAGVAFTCFKHRVFYFCSAHVDRNLLFSSHTNSWKATCSLHLCLTTLLTACTLLSLSRQIRNRRSYVAQFYLNEWSCQNEE
ncbi:hypothetical protein PR048_007338 [Dryococelus australis]|uniref:Mediator of RNA polymerase II transcription subunit 14 n=1 Tax=Dryococelus australis TaxID=614101 RepID=A0ABQ9IDC9_9NEOP|nr:hypothetical protein PR048_007338 [Dryococelus australis]